MATAPHFRPFRLFHRHIHAYAVMGRARILSLENNNSGLGLYHLGVRGKSGSNSQCGNAIRRSIRTCNLTEKEERIRMGKNRF